MAHKPIKAEDLPMDVRKNLEDYLSSLKLRINDEKRALEFAGGPLKHLEDPRQAFVEPIVRTIGAYETAYYDLLKYFPELEEMKKFIAEN